MIFEVFRSNPNRLWYFYLKVRDDEVVAVSDGYPNKADVENIWDSYFEDWTWRERDGDTLSERTKTNKNAGKNSTETESTSESETERASSERSGD